MTPQYQPHLSQHACDRFRERLGVDVATELIEAFILSPDARLWLSWGAQVIHRHRGLRIYAKRGVVTTVTPDDWPTVRNHLGLDRKFVQRKGSGRRPEVAAE